jgi:uncharacterized protein YggT (Ycf19 family)
MEDNKLAADEARRVNQHASVKSQVEGEVEAEIAARAERATPTDAQQVGKVASEFRAKAVDEVIGSERDVGRARVAARISQVIDYIFFLAYALLAVRLLLALLGARGSAGFTKFIFGVTDPLYAPFRGIVASPSAEGHILALPIVIAIIVYVLLHLAINGFLRLIAHRKTAV